MPKKGYTWSEERFEKARAKGDFQKISERMKGVPKSDEHRAAMSKASKGKKKSPEHNAARSAAGKERWAKYRELKEQNPTLGRAEIWKLLAKQNATTT